MDLQRAQRHGADRKTDPLGVIRPDRVTRGEAEQRATEARRVASGRAHAQSAAFRSSLTTSRSSVAIGLGYSTSNRAASSS
jgi:hypothetical protein